MLARYPAGLTDPREGADAVYALLAKAAFENGRAAAPAMNRRTPKGSTEWVDWY